MYLAVLLVLLGCFALVDRRWGLFFWSGNPLRAWLVLLAGTVFFLAWDLVGIANGLFWHGENSLTLGIFVAPELPLEEVFHEPPVDVVDRVLVFLDCGNIDRNPLEVVKRAGTHIVNIDHHHDSCLNRRQGEQYRQLRQDLRPRGLLERRE